LALLAIDGSLARCSVAILVDDVVRGSSRQDGARGHAAILPPMVETVLREAGIAAADIDGIAVTIGPGSFTGLRAAISLAQGLALGLGCKVVGVTVGEALAEALSGRVPPGRAVWAAIDSQRGRVFLEVDGIAHGWALTGLPMPGRKVAIAGDAAQAVACRLAARGADVMLTNVRLPLAEHVARVGARRLAGVLAPLAAQPLYVDPPATRLPAAPPRPPPI
jgi:tRNA threonylcarbamoyladenosine biosynthesis protein TsaB